MIQRLLVLKRKEGDGEIVSLAMVIKHLSSAADVLAIKQLDVGNRSSLYFIVSLASLHLLHGDWPTIVWTPCLEFKKGDAKATK